ncbi:formin-like protein 16 [Mangifera indica]|uniref:formin-like protein 16 n=1 Tax=Mangifera indica TaxID=29780 RepID=UPI001CFA21A7|nr:formin-like protein 16 [Mangifera indica]
MDISRHLLLLLLFHVVFLLNASQTSKGYRLMATVVDDMNGIEAVSRRELSAQVKITDTSKRLRRPLPLLSVPPPVPAIAVAPVPPPPKSPRAFLSPPPPPQPFSLSPPPPASHEARVMYSSSCYLLSLLSCSSVS